MKILFIQLGRIGDMVLLTPLFRAVKENYPDAEIDVVASRRNFSIILNNPHLNKIIVYEKSPVKFLKAVRQIRARVYDYLIDPKDHFSRESRILARLVNAKTKIGFIGDGKKLYDITIPSDKLNKGLHCTERFFNSLKSLSIYIDSKIPKPELFTDTNSDLYVENYLIENKLDNFILFNISATTKDRMFSRTKWFDILKDYDSQNNFVLTFAPTEKVLAKELKSALPFINLFPSRSINDVISLVKKASALITIDTALVHIASAFNTPILSFHVGNEEQIKKYYPLSEVAFVMKSPSSELGIEYIDTDDIKSKLKEFIINFKE
jgi:ADP-heptose:LPS heptosyltransferase